MTASRTDITPGAAVAGAASVARAFRRAAVSQCHPNMLFAVLMPFVIALLGAILLLWLFWSPLTGWLGEQAGQWEVVNQVDAWLVGIGLFSLKLYLIPMIAAAVLLPVSGILGLTIAAIFVMPLVLRHVGQREYAGVTLQGRNATAVSVWNAVSVSVIFAAGWLLTLPLWLVPPMALVLSIFWWAYAFSHMMRVDAIAEHASPEERRLLLKRHNRAFWLIGLICSLINLLPPAWVILPVYSSLVYAHFGLDALARLRGERVIEGQVTVRPE